MVRPVSMPKLGQSEEEAKIVRWLKREGDSVNKGDILFEVETDKALLEVESFFEGMLLKILVKEGETVPVQSTVGYIGAPGEAVPETTQAATTTRRVEVPTPQKPVPYPALSVPRPEAAAIHGETRETPKSATRSSVVPLQPRGARQSETIFRISPRAAMLASEAAVDPSPIVGTGPNGRIVERDVAAYLKAKGYDRLRSTPAAKVLASRENVDILKLEGRRDSGRITVADVRTAIAERPKPMTRMRQVIAERLTRSFTSTPHFFVTVAVDMTDLNAFRSELKAQGKSYTVTDFILKAVAMTLPEFPSVNSTTDGARVMWHSKVHLGLAVSLEEGLLVPVLRDADELSLEGMHIRATELTAKARAGKLTPAEITGSTFTISNMGMLDVENFTAIINPGESAILAVSSILKQCAVVDGQVTARSLMKMTLSSDHRIVDGAMAARFLNAIKNKLEETVLWKRMA